MTTKQFEKQLNMMVSNGTLIPKLLDLYESNKALLSQADRKLGRLEGIIEILPNPELFVAMYVKKKAVLSSQIEGTKGC